jgi:hypothetical protein
MTFRGTIGVIMNGYHVPRDPRNLDCVRYWAGLGVDIRETQSRDIIEAWAAKIHHKDAFPGTMGVIMNDYHVPRGRDIIEAWAAETHHKDVLPPPKQTAPAS